MIEAFKRAILRHGYLFITAAWLYTISFVLTNYVSLNSSPASVKKKLESYIAQREKDFDNLLNDESVIAGILTDGKSEYKSTLTRKDYGIFTYTLNDIGNPLQIYWNTNTVAVNAKDLTRADGSYPVEYPNGTFELIKATKKYKGSAYIIAALIPLHWHYFLQNEYLQNSFAGDASINDFYEITYAESGVPVFNSKNTLLYHIVQKDNVNTDEPQGISIVLRVLAIVLVFAFLNSIANDVVKTRGFLPAFVFLFAGILIMRVPGYFFAFPFNFRSYELFFPDVYGSNDLHRSLGDLLINVVLGYWLITFVKFNNSRWWDIKLSVKKPWLHIVSILALFCLAAITFVFADLIKGMVLDSREAKISFDVTNFFSINGYTVVCFIILIFIILTFYHLAHLLILPSLLLGYTLFTRVMIIVSAALIFVMLNIHEDPIDTRILILLWLIGFILLNELRKKDSTIPLIKSPFFLFWVIFFSASVTLLVIDQYRSKEIWQRRSIAEKLALKSDPHGESMMGMAITGFSDYFDNQQFSKFASETENRRFKDSLLKDNFTGYLNKYDTRIYTFDKNYSSLFNEDSVSFYVLKSIIKNRGTPTGIDDLYYYESISEKFTYIYQYVVRGNLNDTAGYIFIVSRPKLYRTESLFPELFKQESNADPDVNTGYSYAVYNKQKLIASFNDYSFADTLINSQLPKFEFELKRGRGRDELWYDAGGAKIVVVAKKNNWFTEALTFFSYMFTTFILVVILFHLAVILFASRFQPRLIKTVFSFNIRTQIQSIIIFISLFSFIVIGIVTTSFFIKRYYNTNQTRLAKTIEVVAKDVEDRIKSQLTFDEQYDFSEPVANNDLERAIIEISEEHNADVNIYDESGNFRGSTQQFIYNKQILSTKMNPVAYYNLKFARRLQFMQNEHIGDFYYLSAYTPIREKNGDVIAFLNIPYLNTEKELNQEISSFLVTLIDLNALIFLLAGAIALLVTNRITSSFSLISSRMKEINIGKLNEEIAWESQDEIGILVKEYNKMVHKLEESALALARSEREGAWREMARQVAHEIKNPLTPMKLSVQYLQKAIDSNATNVKELTSRVASTLIEQIEQLSKIAADFSQFANIGSNLNIERFTIDEVLESVTNLYRTDTSLMLLWDKLDENCFVEADKLQVSRLFTNLIKNAIEASSDNNPIRILIRQKNENGYVTISVQDYGTGIPNNMQHKIFEPNFTTKSSGTGLGLAICKAIIETVRGHIWFETKENIGSTFFVAIPLAP